MTYADLIRLREQIKSCTDCALREHCTEPVPGIGPTDAPGAQEDQEGKPFVGRSGRLLRDALSMGGISPSSVYITNTVKCRPPGNRTPSHTERLTCRYWLEKEVDLIYPRLIIPVGGIALATFLKENNRITERQGQVARVVWHGKLRWLYPVLHPAAALRRRKTWGEQFERSIRRLSSTLSAVEEDSF